MHSPSITKGKKIEFDGSIANIMPNEKYPATLYDHVLIHAADYSEDSAQGPEFQLNNVNSSVFGSSNIYFPDYVGTGSNMHVVATVGEYHSNSGLFELYPVSVTAR